MTTGRINQIATLHEGDPNASVACPPLQERPFEHSSSATSIDVFLGAEAAIRISTTVGTDFFFAASLARFSFGYYKHVTTVMAIIMFPRKRTTLQATLEEAFALARFP